MSYFALVSHALLAALAWCLAQCKAHPAETTMVVGAVVSTFAKFFAPRLEALPRLKALCDLLGHFGVNTPGVTNAIVRLLTGVKTAAVHTAVGVMLLVSIALGGCAHLTAQDKQDLALYETQNDACVAATPHDKASIDACRAKVRAQWCAEWANRFDAGVCQ